MINYVLEIGGSKLGDGSIDTQRLVYIQKKKVAPFIESLKDSLIKKGVA